MTGKIKLLFAMSLLLNLLLLGMMGGHIARRLANEHSHRAFIEQTLQTLPPERAALIQKKLEELFAQHREQRKAAREARKQTLELLKAEPFDAAAYRREAGKMQELHSESKKDFVDDIAVLADSLSQEERAALAKILKRPPHKRNCFSSQ